MRSRPSRRAPLGAALLAVLAGSGCYTYQPTDPATITPESRVRVTVSSREAAELEDALRGVRPTFVATYLGRTDGGQLLLSVPLFDSNPGTSTRAVHNRVSVPADQVVAVEGRSLSTWRTAAVVLAGAAAVGLGGYQVFGSDDGGDDKGKPGTDEAWIPLIRIPLGR